MNTRSVTVVVLAAVLLPGLSTPLAWAHGQSEIVPNSIVSASDRVESVRANNPQAGNRLVYRVTEMASVSIVNVTYDTEHGLCADLFYPPGTFTMGDDGRLRPTDQEGVGLLESLPVMIQPMTSQKSTAWIQGMESYRDQPAMIDLMALFASVGIVGVTYDVEGVDQSWKRLLEFLTEQQTEFGLDMSRVGLFVNSGHGGLAGKIIGQTELADTLQCVVSFHSNTQVLTAPNRVLAFFVVHSGGYATFDQYGQALAIRASGLGYRVVEVANAPIKGFESEMDTPRSRALPSCSHS